MEYSNRLDLKELTYKGVESLDSIALEVGIGVDELIKLDANENVYGSAEPVYEAIEQAMRSRLHIYPDPSQYLLRQELASRVHTSLSPEWICCGAGSDDLLDIVVRLFAPRAIVVSTPTFGMYKFLGQLAGSQIVDVPRLGGSFELDVDGVVGALDNDDDATLVFLPSPNNPTGNLLPLESVQRLCRCRAVVVIDEAYADFARGPSAETLLAEHSNLIVTRTFSKWAGLAGVRVGYALAHPSIAERMMSIKQPYNVNVAADAAARAALEHREQIMVTVDAMRDEKDRIFECIRRHFGAWIRPCPSDANFVLCELLDGAPLGAHELFLALRRRGILVRYFGSQGGPLQNFFRVSAGRPEHTDAFLAALRAIELTSLPSSAHEANASSSDTLTLSDFNADTILFDMDGVLADVTKSYRQAIIDTASHFGVAIDLDDIAAAKAQGDANNDWILTHRLIAASAGNDSAPSLDQVTEQFEALYQGSLWRNESLLIDGSVLAALADKFALAIVTGRPRKPDAERFLSAHSIDTHFKCSVCMSDEPAKPSPRPVMRALAELGSSFGGRAIMIGDTPDDIVAAVRAGVLAVGVAPPDSSNVGAVVDSLRAAGASFVYKGNAELQCALEQLCSSKTD
jgi:histidinol-phosphate aminotransferase